MLNSLASSIAHWPIPVRPLTREPGIATSESVELVLVRPSARGDAHRRRRFGHAGPFTGLRPPERDEFKWNPTVAPFCSFAMISSSPSAG